MTAELEAERDAAKQWATELQGRQRHHIARIEHLEAALRRAREFVDHGTRADMRDDDGLTDLLRQIDAALTTSAALDPTEAPEWNTPEPHVRRGVPVDMNDYPDADPTEAPR